MPYQPQTEYDFSDEYERQDDRSIAGYRTMKIYSGDYMEYIAYPFRRASKVAMRAAKRRETREAQKQLNKRNSERNLIRLLNANFKNGDLWVTPTYDEEHLPQDMESARKDVKNYLRRLDYWMKKHGLSPLKYIYVTECHDNGESVRIHHHIVMNFPDRDIAERMWKLGKRTQTRRLQADQFGYAGLGKYISKAKKGKYKKTWTASRNLVKPKLTVSDCAMTKRKMRRLCASYHDGEEVLERINPRYKVADIQVTDSAVVPGMYLYARLYRRRE